MHSRAGVTARHVTAALSEHSSDRTLSALTRRFTADTEDRNGSQAEWFILLDVSDVYAS